MRRNTFWIIGAVVVLVILGAGGFTAARLMAGPQGEDDLPAGAAVFEDVFDDGSGNPITVKTVIMPSEELPDRPSEASGVFKRQEDNSYYVGTGSISINVNTVNGETTTAVDHSGPEIEVVADRDTIFYEDVTEFEIEKTESTEQVFEQQLRQLDSAPLTIPEGGSFVAWGEQRGDRVVAEVIVFSEVR